MAPLSMWTIYDHPLDYPSSYVARRLEVHGSRIVHTQDVIIGPTLEAVRSCLPSGLYGMERAPEDDPVIVEVWF